MTIWILATFVAYVIKGLTGFANTLVLSTILSFKNNNINISPIDLCLGLPANAFFAFKERKKIQLRNCLLLSSLVIIGSIPGVFFLKNTDAGVVKLIFGFVIVGLGISMLLRENSKEKAKASLLSLVTIGLISGILCGLYGIGALLSAYVSRVTEDTDAFKGNISLIFFLENLFRLIVYTATGIVTMATVKQAVMLVPFMLVGLGAGVFCSSMLDEKIVKKLVIIMLILSGVALIVNQIF